MDDVDLSGVAVLVVEDDADSRELLEQLLLRRHASVTAFAAGAEAIEFLSMNRADVMVFDIGMSGMDGYRLLETIRRQEEQRGRVGVPAIALTAYQQTRDIVRAGAAGYQRHLAKPIEPEKLLRAIAELAGGGRRT